jgi:hypothetical protein
MRPEHSDVARKDASATTQKFQSAQMMFSNAATTHNVHGKGVSMPGSASHARKACPRENHEVSRKRDGTLAGGSCSYATLAQLH